MICDRYKLCKISRICLNVGLSVIFLLVVYIGLLLDGAAESSEGILYITVRCRLMVDYVMLTLVILVGGSLLIDCVSKGKIK